MDDWMLVQTTRFGELNVQDNQIVYFEKGLPGFPEEKRYIMIELQEYRPFLFMQSIEDPNLMFILVDPYVYFAEYPTADVIAMEAEWSTEEKERLLVRVIATIRENGNVTVNLVAPILIHTRLNRGEQVILQTVRGFTTRHLLVMNQPNETKEEVHP
jgi:flagellar assembly factor FliW